ncbi:hypothetical protein [Sulfurimonas sp. HSL3-7]
MKNGFEGVLKLRLKVLFMNVPYKQGKLFWEEVMLVLKLLREELGF